MANIQTYNIDNVIKNDTYNGFTAQINVNNAPLDLTGYSIRMYLREGSKTGAVRKALSTINGEISITDAANGDFSILPFIADIPAKTYFYDIEFTIGAIVKTYLEGTFNVIQDVTYG